MLVPPLMLLPLYAYVVCKTELNISDCKKRG